MGTAPLWVGASALLAAPVFLAFRSGGYGLKSQLIVGCVAFVLLAVVAVAAPWPPLPRGIGLAALVSLIGYGLWTGLSTGWARVLDRAVQDTDRVGMYCASFALALAVMRLRTVRRVLPEVFLAGIVVGAVYALAGRLLPHLVHQHLTALRLSQPLTYWNALGVFTGFGVVLGVCVAGDITRPPLRRALACAATVPCGLACLFTLSRGAAASVVTGLVLCAMLRWKRSTLLAIGCAAAGIGLVSATLLALPRVLSLSPHHPVPSTANGAIFLVIAVVGTVATGTAFARVRRSRGVGRGPLPSHPRMRAVLAGAVVPLALLAGVFIAYHSKEKVNTTSAASRITTTETNRGHYWRVAIAAFRRHPLDGVGSGSFAAEWRRHRGKDTPALDAHSLYVETLAELGIVGALLLGTFLATVGVGTVRALRASPRDPTVIAAAAVLGTFAVHAGLDWDWEMPAVSLIPLILAAAVLQPAPRRSQALT